MGRSKECTILQATLLLAAAVSAIAETNVSTSSSAQNQTQQGSNLTITTSSSALLNKGAFAVCPSRCHSYRGGAALNPKSYPPKPYKM